MRRLVVAVVMLGGCKATTGRPTFVPFPEAEHSEVGFDLANEDSTVFMVTDTLAARLRADSIPVRRVKRIDGFMETGWFDARTFRPTTGRPLGPDVVKVRAWVDPGKPGYSRIEVETVYVPRADPSLPERELEHPVSVAHPINRRVGELVKKLAEQYGVPAEQQEPKAAGPKGADAGKPGAVPDSGAKGKPVVRPAPPTPKPSPPPPPPPPPRSPITRLVRPRAG